MELDQEKMSAIKSALDSVIEQVNGLIANGDVQEDEPMEANDVKSVMDDVTKDVTGMEETPLKDEMQDFFKKKNLGHRPKGIKAIMVEAKVAKPKMAMDMGFKKGKR